MASSSLTRKEFVRFVALMRNLKSRVPIPEMTRERFLNTVAIAYEGVFVDPDWLGSMSFHTGLNISLLMSKGITAESIPASTPGDRYKALADGRDGGPSNLPMSDPEAFSWWYASDARTGQHPFEIVTGDRSHGILLRIDPVGAETEGWVYELSVDTSMFYAMAVRIALAVERAGPLCGRGLRARDWRPCSATRATSR